MSAETTPARHLSAWIGAWSSDSVSSHAPVGYWAEARRPFPSLLFLCPLLLAYELGVAIAGDSGAAIRNGADCWMRSLLHVTGSPVEWLLPLLVLGGLLVWQFSSRQPWKCSLDTLTGMIGESLLFALLLIVLGQSLNLLFGDAGAAEPAVAIIRLDVSSGSVVSFIGAGIYEEVAFRLILLPTCYLLLRSMLVPRRTSAVTAVILTSLVFAVAHYVEPTNGGSLSGTVSSAVGRVWSDPTLWYGFTFRAVAGLLFAGLFVLRGLGITVGCHAAYDLLVGILMQPPDPVIS